MKHQRYLDFQPSIPSRSNLSGTNYPSNLVTDNNRRGVPEGHAANNDLDNYIQHLQLTIQQDSDARANTGAELARLREIARVYPIL